jgi:hypothetical protein
MVTPRRRVGDRRAGVCTGAQNRRPGSREEQKTSEKQKTPQLAASGRMAMRRVLVHP